MKQKLKPRANLNPRLLQLKSMKHLMQMKKERLTNQKQMLQAKGARIKPLPPSSCIRATTPEQIFKEHIHNTQQSHSLIRKCASQSKYIGQEIQKPLFKELIYKQDEASLSKILSPDYEGKQDSLKANSSSLPEGGIWEMSRASSKKGKALS